MVTATPTQTLTLTRTIKAKPEQVYLAFTDRDRLRDWFTGDAHLNATENGHVLFHWYQEQYYAMGVFTKLEKDKTVAFTWRGMGENHDSLVTIDIAAKGDKTAVTLTHSNFADDADISQYQENWETRLDNLVVALEEGADKRITDRVIIGIFPGQLTEDRAKALGVDPAAALINGLVDGYSAALAGLKAGDVVVKVNGTTLNADTNIGQTLGDKGVGDSVEVVYYRDGEKHTVDLELGGYPVPELPKDFKALSERVAGEHAEIKKTLDDIFKGVSEAEAAKRPAEGEWSANEVLAHLILDHRRQQNWIGGLMQGPEISGYTCNTPARIAGVTQTYKTNAALLAELKRAMDELVAILANVPDEYLERKTNLWWTSFEFTGWNLHTQSHFDQIRNAIAAAKA